MMTKKGCTKIVNFMTPRAWGSGVMPLLWICIIFYSINIEHIDCYCVKGLWCCLPIQLLIFYSLYDGAIDIQIWTPLTRSQCKVSYTQVTVKACRPLVSKTSNLTLTFDQFDLKINRAIYSLMKSTLPSLATFKQKGQKMFSRHRLVYRLTVVKQYAPFIQRGAYK